MSPRHLTEEAAGASKSVPVSGPSNYFLFDIPLFMGAGCRYPRTSKCGTYINKIWQRSRSCDKVAVLRTHTTWFDSREGQSISLFFPLSKLAFRRPLSGYTAQPFPGSGWVGGRAGSVGLGPATHLAYSADIKNRYS